MPNRYLVDVNLPKYFSFFNTPHFFFVADLDLTLSDDEIWENAISNNLIILTKDTDFHLKFLLFYKTPKVVLFRLGNQTLRDLHNYFSLNWKRIEELINDHNLVIAYPDTIEAQF